MVIAEAGPADLGAAELLVTTGPHASEAMIARARTLAERFGVPYVRRRGSITSLLRDAGARHAYIAGRDRDELRGDGEILYIHPGLFYLKRDAGPAHPLLRAVCPDGEAPVESIIDCTLGLANDAVFLASIVGARVVGCESSVLLGALLEEGLPRMAAQGRGWSEGAGRVELVRDDAVAHMRSMADGAVDVAYLDPMFEAPLGAGAGFGLVRRFAMGAPLSLPLVQEAARVAARRVVLKVPGAAPAPEITAGPGWNRRVRGQAVDYVIIERAPTR